MNVIGFDSGTREAQRQAMLIAFLLAAATASPESETIVVTGVPLSQLKAEAERCEKGGCTPRQDIVATVRYAEGLFRVGRYVDSRQKLQKAIGRNRGVAKSDPAAMSALYEATATVARHDGEQYVVEASTYARPRLMHDVSAPDSPERLLADLDVIDVESARREPVQTSGKYARLTAHALELGQPAIAARALLHHASFAQVRGRKGQANALLQRIISGQVAAPPAYRLVARAVAARFAREAGDASLVDALVADFANQPKVDEPVLVWAPAMPRPADTITQDPTVIPTDFSRNPAAEYFTVRWVDIGFTIRSDGNVESAEVLRGNRGPAWAAPLVKAISARRYMPLKAESELGYRVERWTLTADYDTPKGSLIRRRARSPHFEQLDVSGEPPKTAEVKPLRTPSPAG